MADAAGQRVGRVERGENCFAGLLGQRRGFVRVLAQVLDQRHELVAAHARRAAGGAEAGFEAPRDLDQQLVADFVAARIVDQLEVVEIDEQQRSVAAVAGAAGERLLEAVVEQATIWQAGQPVVEGEVDDLLFSAFALGDVGHRYDVVRDLAACAAHRGDSRPGRGRPRPSCVAPAIRRARNRRARHGRRSRRSSSPARGSRAICRGVLPTTSSATWPVISMKAWLTRRIRLSASRMTMPSCASNAVAAIRSCSSTLAALRDVASDPDHARPSRRSRRAAAP